MTAMRVITCLGHVQEMQANWGMNSVRCASQALSLNSHYLLEIHCLLTEVPNQLAPASLDGFYKSSLGLSAGIFC